MNFKAFLLLGASVSAAFFSKEKNNSLDVLLDATNYQDDNIDAQAVCKNAKDIVIMADLSGVTESAGWNNYVLPFTNKLVRSFEISKTETRIELFSRFSTSYNGYWCIHVDLYSDANSNLNTLLAAIQVPCHVFSPGGLSTVVIDIAGSRRQNIPVEILILTDWMSQNSGLDLYDADQIKELGGVRFVCAGVGTAVDYGYLGSLCGNNIIKIANYGAIINSADQIANNLCKGINTPTIPEQTKVPTLAPNQKPTAIPTTLPPTFKPSPLLTFSPTKAVTKVPTKKPTKVPTNIPTKKLTKSPTKKPTKVATNMPTKKPTKVPTKKPTKVATNMPTKKPTKAPTKKPTKAPITTKLPTKFPTRAITNKPTKKRLKMA